MFSTELFKTRPIISPLLIIYDIIKSLIITINQFSSNNMNINLTNLF